jgi:CHAT domain-containing protein/tetratricopeptide (TPR) repeat protein
MPYSLFQTLLCLFFLTFSHLATAQTTPILDSLAVHKSAVRYQKSGKLEKAKTNFEAAVEAYKTQNNAAGTVAATIGLARTLFAQSQNEAAITLLQKAIATTNDQFKQQYIGLLGYINGSIESQNMNLPAALTAYNTAIKAYQASNGSDKQLLIGVCYNNIGALYEKKSDWQNAQTYYQRAYDIAQKNKDANALSAMALYNMAYPMEEQGNYEGALLAYRKVIDAYKTTRKTEGKDEAEVYTAMSGCYLQLRNLTQARFYAERSLNISLKDKAQTDNANIISTNILLADVEQVDNQPQKALVYLKSAEKLAQAAHDDYQLSDVWRLQATIFSENYSLGDAEQPFKNVIAYNDAQESPIAAARARLNLAVYRFKKGNQSYTDLLPIIKPIFAKAHLYANLGVVEALEWAQNSNKNKDALRISALNRCLQPTAAIRKLTDPINPAAVVQYEQYLQILNILIQQSEGNEKAYFAEKAVQYLIYLRQSIRAEGSKINIAKLTRQFCNDALRQAAAQNDADAAFRFIEYAKSLSVLEAQQRNQMRQRANLPADVLAQETKLKTKLFILQKQLYNDEAPEKNLKNNEIYANIAVLHDELEALEDKINLKNKVKTSSTIANLKDLQNALQPNEAFLDYYLNENELHLLLIQTKTTAFFTIKMDNAELKNKISALLLAIKTNNQTDFITQNLALTQCLFHFNTNYIENLLANKKHWIIAPDDALFQVPYDLLAYKTQAANTLNFNNFPYLIQQHSLVFQYSATLYLQSKKYEYNSIFKRGLLAFAPFSDRSTLPTTQFAALPFSKKEVEGLRQNANATIFTSSQATKQNFLQNATKYGILHLATHTIYDSTDHEYNLVFHGDKNYTFLKNYEIAYSTLAAELVTLSACNAANGVIETGEGAASLARAFAYAGSPNVATTLWEVPDQANATIIALFYENLQKSMQKDDALREAKLQYLRTANPQAANPQYWAGLIIIGNNQALVTLNNRMSYYWLILPAILLFLASVFWYKKKNKKNNKKN